MSFRSYLFFMALATLLSWGGWFLVLWGTNPLENGISAFILFYLTLGFGLIGTLTLLGTGYRVVFLKHHDIVNRVVRTSFRHAIFFSGVAVSALALSAQNWLYWWAFLLLIVGVSLLEYLCLVKEASRR